MTHSPSHSAIPELPSAALEAAAARLKFPDFLASDYEYLSVLGHGGNGKVFWAIDRETSEEVAIKVLPKRHDVERTERELLLQLDLDHPRIIGCRHAGVQDGVAFIVLEAAYGTLEEYPAQNKGLKEWWQALRQAHEGAGYLHSRGLVHRDLKPANILVTATGAKLGDLGLTLDPKSARITQRGAVVGTPGYLSPEAARGEPVGASADIFALGVMFYQAIEGHLPYPGEDRMAQMQAVAKGHLLPSQRGRLLLSLEALRCLEGMLSVIPERRPTDLSPLLDDEPWLRLPNPTKDNTDEFAPPEAEVFGAYAEPQGTPVSRRCSRTALWGLAGVFLFAMLIFGTLGASEARISPAFQHKFPHGAGFRTGR